MPERRVTKAEAELLIGAIDVGDTPGFLETLTTTLVRLTGSADADWHGLTTASARIGGWTAARLAAVDQQDLPALEQLAIDLSELRTLRVDD